MVKWAALVLAGGQSSRFQSEGQTWVNKALAEIDGKPLLAHVVAVLMEIVSEVAICVNNTERKDVYSQALMEHGVENAKFVLDQDSPVHGPLLAITSGMHAVSAEYCLTVPTDMPFLNPEVARYLLSAAEGYDVTVPMWPNGKLETLLMTLKCQTAVKIADTMLLAEKANADVIARGAGKLLLPSPMQQIKSLDPELKSFVNINSPQDLKHPNTRSTEGEIRENLSFDSGKMDFSALDSLKQGLKLLGEGKSVEAQGIFSKCTEFFDGQGQLFWAGLAAEKLAQSTFNSREAFLSAAKKYQAEAEHYRTAGCRVLAQRADADAAWCQKQAV